MDRSPHPARLSSALERFRLFFDELRGLYLERNDVIDQAAMALLGREHHLITGPPGTAKSGLASAIVGRRACSARCTRTSTRCSTDATCCCDRRSSCCTSAR